MSDLPANFFGPPGFTSGSRASKSQLKLLKAEIAQLERKGLGDGPFAKALRDQLSGLERRGEPARWNPCR